MAKIKWDEETIIKRLTGTATLMALILSFIVTGSALAAGDEETEATAEYSKGVKRCMSCHKEGKDLPAHEIFQTPMGISGDPAAPFAEGNHDCEACHGPSKSHLKRAKDGSRPSPAITFGENTPVEDQNGACLGCHEGG